jgi:hypothetical protein
VRRIVHARLDKLEQGLDLAGDLGVGLASDRRARRGACREPSARREHASGKRRGG